VGSEGGDNRKHSEVRETRWRLGGGRLWHLNCRRLPNGGVGKKSHTEGSGVLPKPIEEKEVEEIKSRVREFRIRTQDFRHEAEGRRKE